MFEDYALLTLTNEKQTLEEKKKSIETGDGSWHIVNAKEELAKIKKQIDALDFAINVVKGHQG